MTRESAVLAEELAIVLWLTAVANVFIYSYLNGLLLESMHRERYGRFRTRWQLTLDVVRRPISAPMTIGRDWIERLRALFDTADDPNVERERRRLWTSFGVYAGMLFIGLPVSFVLVAVVRFVLPGMVTIWVAVVDVILLAVWARRGARALASGSRRLLIVSGSVIGGLVCVLSMVVSIVLWQVGGIAL